MNLSTFIERWAETRPHHVAIDFHGTTITYAQLWRRVDETTLRLAGLGVHAGDRVSWFGYNHPDLLAMLFALARLGAILVPLNFRLAAPENLAVLEHAEVSVLVVEPDFYSMAGEFKRAMPLLKLVGTRDAPQGWFGWEGPPPAGFAPKLPGRDADPVMIVYTSGTTGRPKGAVHTQEGMLWNIVAAIPAQDITANDNVLMGLPMFHVGGLCIQTLPVLHAGGRVTLHARFDPARWLEDVVAKRPTISLLVPATARVITELPAWANTDLSSLRAINMGSSVVPLNLIDRFSDRGVPVMQVYGATETGPVSIVLRPEDALTHRGSTGKVALACEVRLVDADGRDVSRGQVGEIWVRGRNLMRGYWKDPDNPAFQEGWFHTGDLARIDADGYYWVVGRSKDMIISGGENIYPAEIENLLAESPDVLECAVVGQADPKWGEVAVAAIVKKSGSNLDAAAVTRLFEGRIARYKHPRRIVFLESLPKTALGKVQKADLVKRLAEG